MKTRGIRNVLHTPVVLEVLEEFVLEEERGVVAAWDVNPRIRHNVKVHGEGQDSHMFRYGTLPANQIVSITERQGKAVKDVNRLSAQPLKKQAL